MSVYRVPLHLCTPYDLHSSAEYGQFSSPYLCLVCRPLRGAVFESGAVFASRGGVRISMDAVLLIIPPQRTVGAYWASCTARGVKNKLKNEESGLKHLK